MRANVKSFRDAIKDISKQFGKELATIDALPVSEEKKEEIKVKRHKEKADRVVLPRPETRPVVYDRNDKDFIRTALRVHLQEHGYELVLDGFRYQGDLMDLFCTAEGRVIEYAIAMDRVELSQEMTSVYRMGNKIVLKKHDQMKKGKCLSNFFFFVVPEFFEEKLPDYAGIIQFRYNQTNILPSFYIVRAPAMLHAGFIAPGTYKQVAQHLERRNGQLIAKYEHSVFGKITYNSHRETTLFKEN